MTFSSETKSELCRAALTRDCLAAAELYGMLLFAPAFGHTGVRMTTENAELMRRAVLLFSRVFGIRAEPEMTGRRLVLRITEEDSLRRILTAFGYDFKSNLTYHLNRNVIENDCCAPAFLRGVFLTAGSVAGPDKKSHLEIRTGHAALAREVMSLMLDLGLAPKCTERETSSLIYFKDTARIEDLLTMLGAPRAAMSIMEAKVEKTLRNAINRQVNCETANMVKTSAASVRQIAAIEQALERGGIEIFPENLRETVDLRVAYPEATLLELASKFEPPISKPGLSHRLKRIMTIAERAIEGEP